MVAHVQDEAVFTRRGVKEELKAPTMQNMYIWYGEKENIIIPRIVPCAQILGAWSWNDVSKQMPISI